MFILNSNLRLKFFLILALIISILLIIRILYLSSINPQDYNMIETSTATLKRGDIFDKNDRLVASSLEVDSVYINPKEIKNKNSTIFLLMKTLDSDKASISEKINSNKNFVWLKRQISPRENKLLKDQKLSGIYITKEYKRFYPNRNLASHIIGFCNIDNKGVEGIEKSFDSYLLPDNKKNDYYLNNTELTGDNITLTIDSNVQAIAETTLKNAIIDENAESGTLIFFDGLTGEIIALANSPDFDPNKYTDYYQKSFRNLAIFNQFEPGSVFKIFTIASLLDAGLITKNDYFLCTGAYHKDDLTVKDTGIHGLVNIAKIFKYSCNVGTLEAASRIKNSNLYNYLKLFGFGESISIMLPGEQPGLFRDVSLWSSRSMLAIPIGQEISVNALQIVRATSTFINDGIMIEPYIIKAVTNSKNNVIKMNSRKEIRRVLRKGISEQIITAMGSATDEIGGTVRLLKIEGLNFAAKSGTAEIYDLKVKKYADNDVTSTLLTIFPLEKPRYIAYVVFHKPRKGQTVQWGGIIGAKLLKDFITRLTGYIDFNTFETIKIKENDVVLNNNLTKIISLPAIMPDLKGLNAGDATDIFSNLNIKIQIEGSGIVYDQILKSDEKLSNNTEIKLFLKD